MCRILKMVQMNLQNKNRVTDIENKRSYLGERRWERGKLGDWTYGHYYI